MAPKKNLGISAHLYCEPLRGSGDVGAPFTWNLDAAARNAIGLKDRQLDAAFLTPISYARESSLYYIVPRVAVASTGADATITLHVREGLQQIRTIAVDPSSSSEIVLTKIILMECFDLSPKIVPFSGSLEEALAKADAALLVGDPSLRAQGNHESALDLVEEWNELTGLPYVHGFWCGREHSLTMEEIRLLQQACTEGLGDLDGISSRAPLAHTLNGYSPAAIRDYLDGFTFVFAEEEEEGVREFNRYAFYHAALPDIPELQFYGSPAPG
jgi:chorismate dehydratase